MNRLSQRQNTFDSESMVDKVNWRILASLQQDGRLSMAELGRRVGLSPPATAERVRRLEDAGVIQGYRAIVNPKALGRGVLAFLRISAIGNVKEKVLALVSQMPEILECHRGSGSECFILKVSCRSVGDLEVVADRFAELGMLTTAIVLSSFLTSRTIDQLPENENSPV